MTLEDLKSFYNGHPKALQLADHLNELGCRIHLKGLIGAADTLTAMGVLHHHNTPQLFVLADKEEAAYFHNNLEALQLDGIKVLFFPASYKLPYKVEDTDNANVLMRAEVLNELNQHKSKVAIVTYGEALTEKVVTQKHLRQNTLELKRGQSYSIDFINELLIEYEFDKVDYVYEPGQFSVRGGIVDVFSFSNEDPYRIEFFGDEVDSIRTFNPIDQLSITKYDYLSIVPNVQQKLLEESRETFLEYVPESTVVWLKSTELTADKIEKQYGKAAKAFNKLKTPLNHLPPEELYTNKEQFLSQLNDFSIIEFGTNFYFTPQHTIAYDQAPQPTFKKNFDLLTKNFKTNAEAGFKNIIVAGNPKQIERLYNIYEDKQEAIRFTPILVALHEGFVDKDNKIACYTDHQIFERFHRFKLKERFKRNKQALTIKELHNLQKGDFVTHIDHGVGRFSGLETIDLNGKKQEAIRLVYAGNDIVYVSIHSLHRIAKYTGKEGATPKLNKVGSPAWQTAKNKTKKKVKEIAFNLIKLYAERKAKKGFPFSPDSYLQHEMEASFMYEETPDQDKAIKAVKKDMEAEAPMDRLVCGDVGFGKTEVAIRAAFKAVSDSKQVALLAPTTILTFQHYNTIRARLKNMPCTVDYLNRFKTAKQQKETIRKLKAGEVDIIVGTHRLIGKDIEFKDLGLLIIDEEQKFGVAAKDKLKTIKVNVDTLTLTATPIPRTLQFSMMGARDLSTITTPPPNRQPVQTELQTFSEEVIRDAIRHEVSRGGQVFFVHNRVQNIEEVAGMVQRLCPGVRVAIGHGQMEGPKLEKIMINFIEGEFDVLIATTIIESGIDIPNANTIIINHAHMFGLSDLHQLRGRVGRSNRKAYCYLLAPSLISLTDDARRRLKAIEQFSDLGSGFNIAMRDLDIRGAGNMLGGEQSGFISDIGFDMYQKILDEAIQELKETAFKDLYQEEQIQHQEFVKECQIETDFELLIPDDYVNNIPERLSLYRELDNLPSEEDLQRFQLQLEDRFGPIPSQTADLMNTIRLRWLAKDIGLEKLILKSSKLIGHFVSNQDSYYYQSPKFSRVLEFIKQNPTSCKMYEKGGKLRISFNDITSVQTAITTLNAIAKATPTPQV